MLQENKAITDLKLSNCGLGQEGLFEVCDVIRMNTVLTSLNLSTNKFNGQSLVSLGKLFIISSGHGHSSHFVCL